MAFEPHQPSSSSSDDIDAAKLSAGYMGKLFGTGENGPINIAGICVLLGFGACILISGILVYKGSQSPYEIWKYVTPIITGALGFIFGRGSH